jgi:GINS complex subunit 4
MDQNQNMADQDDYYENANDNININFNNNLNLKEYTHSLTIPNNQKLISQLQKIWSNEKFSKSLLKYEDEFVSELIELIEKREKEIEKMLNHRSGSSTRDATIKEDAEILELDLDRTKFLLKDYLRIRLFKIEKFLYYIIKNDLSSLLSKNEFDFAFELFKNKRNYFNENFNKKIHESFNDFVPNNIKDEIVVAPHNNSYIFCRSNTNERVFIYMKDIWNESGEDITIETDEVYCLPHICVK